MFGVFGEKEGSGRPERRNGSQRWHLQVLHAQASQSRVALFVNLSSIHLYAFVTFCGGEEWGQEVLFFPFKLPFENVNPVSSKLKCKGCYS